MTSSGRGRRRRLIAVVALSAIAWSSHAAAQGVSGPALKAAFVFNFAKFASWPADALAPKQRLTLCVVGDAAVADALEQIIKHQIIDGHELTLQTFDADGPLRGCRLLYVSGLDPKRAAQLLDTLKGAPVLSVGDGERFVEDGGVAQLLIERDRMRFVISLAASRRSGIMLSSKLLSLAKMVRDEHDVPH